MTSNKMNQKQKTRMKRDFYYYIIVTMKYKLIHVDNNLK